MEEVDAAVIGAGPAGLAAAEALVEAGLRPLILDAMPTPARKFLMAGKSGLNLTKDEPFEEFVAAFRCPQLRPMLEAFGPREAVEWAEGLGQSCFTGSSGRVFPQSMKASPLLRQWLARLEGAELRTRWRWTGWAGDALAFDTPGGRRTIRPRATILALGGASWPRLGSDAAWVPRLEERGIALAPFRPANMGFDVDWSEHMRERFAGAPVKGVTLCLGEHEVRGEFVVTRTGVEGSAVYAISAPLRDALETGPATLRIDLAPDRGLDQLIDRLMRPKGKRSLANHLRRTVGIEGVKAALLRECAPEALGGPVPTAEAIKALPLPVARPRPIAEAISSAGGVAWEAVDSSLMLRDLPSTFIAGEMLDWEAPTGGYLLTACIATGRWAGARAAARIRPGP